MNSFAYRIGEFAKHYDGVHVLLKNRDEVGEFYLPDQDGARVVRDFGSARAPAHYHHNWRFNNLYQK